jgi:hypothetical protein
MIARIIRISVTAAVLAGLILPVAVGRTMAQGYATENYVLWNKLGSETEISSSEIGVDGIYTGPLAFASVQHGDGAALQSGSAQIMFEELFGTFFPDSGTIEFWWIPQHDENSGGTHHHERYPFIISSDDVGQSPGWPVLLIKMHSFGHSSSYHLTAIDFGMWTGGYSWNSIRHRYDLNFSAGQLMHVAITWDKSLGGAPLRFYVDGVFQAPYVDDSTNPELAIQDIQDAMSGGFAHQLELLRFSNRPDGAGHQYDSEMYIDNFKILNHAKTDFSDRFIEGPELVAVDVKPGSCPNPLNVRSRGVLPVAILGTLDLDVEQIDAASIRLEGVAPIHSSIEDVGAPFYPFVGKEHCDFDCNDWGPDGLMDLTLKFKTQEIVSALANQEGGCMRLTISGNLKEEFGGGPVLGEDVVMVLNRGGAGKRSLDKALRDRRDRVIDSEEDAAPEVFQPRR